MLFVSITRRKVSLDYRRRPPAADIWHTNDQNNSLDDFEIFEIAAGGQFPAKPVFSCLAQTVSNTEGLIPGARFNSTIAPGKLGIRAFVDQRTFYGRIHGIVNATTMDGRTIGMDSVTKPGEDRWLVHDWQKHRLFFDKDGTHSNPPGDDTRVAWSAGCFVLADRDLAELGFIFDNAGIKPGEIVTGELREE